MCLFAAAPFVAAAQGLIAPLPDKAAPASECPFVSLAPAVDLGLNTPWPFWVVPGGGGGGGGAAFPGSGQGDAPRGRAIWDWRLQRGTEGLGAGADRGC